MEVALEEDLGVEKVLGGIPVLVKASEEGLVVIV